MTKRRPPAAMLAILHLGLLSELAVLVRSCFSEIQYRLSRRLSRLQPGMAARDP